MKIRRGPLAYEILKVIILEFVKDFLDFGVHGVKVRVGGKQGVFSMEHGAYSVRSEAGNSPLTSLAERRGAVPIDRRGEGG